MPTNYTTSPLVNTVQTFYLKAASRYPITYYLITTPLQDELLPARMDEVRQAIVEWTECKPWPVQAICLVVLEIREEDRELPDNQVTVRMPASLEQNETGEAIVSTQNLTQTQLHSITISLISTDIAYKKEGSNRTIFDAIDVGETKFWEPEFTAYSSTLGTIFISEVLIANGTTGFSETDTFNIPKRLLPIKQYWGLLSFVFVAISSFVAKPDLIQFVVSLISGLSGSQGKG